MQRLATHRTWLRKATANALRRHSPITTTAPLPLLSLSLRQRHQLPRPTTQSFSSASFNLSSIEPASSRASHLPTRKLPLQCTGCGAFSQTVDPDSAGYYNPNRNSVKAYLKPARSQPAKSEEEKSEDDTVAQTLKSLDPKVLEQLGLSHDSLIRDDVAEDQGGALSATHEAPSSSSLPPLCERCHNLVHHHTGVSIYHPSVGSLRRTIEESPYKRNHIYHVIDAADFPMSLVPKLNRALGDITLRSHNRRARTENYVKGRKVEMSFVITRSDLLAPTKEQVDSLLPYLREVLRKALGRLGKQIRLGEVRCVSSKRGWWHKVLKEDVWHRGGAIWMVGKANVGKSQLFEAIYPKGRWVDKARGTLSRPVSVDMFAKQAQQPTSSETEAQTQDDNVTNKLVDTSEDGVAVTQEPEPEPEPEPELIEEDAFLDPDALLPPAQRETQYPPMPVVSSLPGTTAAPIRIPFGNGRGELIDLPGLSRSDLELFVKEKDRQSLIMKSRVVPEQESIKPRQSLILGGGLIRITPRTPDMVFLSYNFTPLDSHVTSTEKATKIQAQDSDLAISTIATPAAATSIKHAGSFVLQYDVTKRRSGPITSRDFLARKSDSLPWRVFAIDILVESVGWVEIVAQISTHQLYRKPDTSGKGNTELWTSPEDPLDPEDAEVEAKPKIDSFAAFENALETTTITTTTTKPSKKPEKSKPTKTSNTDEDPFSQWEAKTQPNRPEPRGKPDQPKKEGPILNWPVIDVYSPQGRFIGSREPMNGWLLNKPLVLAKHLKSRPRKSMKGAKKREKIRKRAITEPKA